MNRFTIEYYYEKYHTGTVNCDKARTAVVFAKNKQEAIAKVRSVDDLFISIKNMTFEEIQGGD